MEKNAHLLDNVDENKEELMGFFSSVFELSVNSKKDYEEIKDIITEMNQKLLKFDTSKKKKAKQTLMMYLIAAPKEKIGPY